MIGCVGYETEREEELEGLEGKLNGNYLRLKLHPALLRSLPIDQDVPGSFPTSHIK